MRLNVATIDEIRERAQALLTKLAEIRDAIGDLCVDADEARDYLSHDDGEIDEDYAEMDRAASALEEAYDSIFDCEDGLTSAAM